MNYLNIQALVCFVWVLLTNMLLVFYHTIIPTIYAKASFPTFVIHFILGNWLAVNTFFHYTMGLITNPGYPPNVTIQTNNLSHIFLLNCFLFKANIENITTICRKCVSPKPARTHHCSICKRCILKMVN